MVTSTHETSHRIFQDHPEVLTPAFKALGLPPPAKAIIEALTPDATEVKPLERRVDTVLRVEPSEGDGFLIAIEAQTARSPGKGSSWSYYVAYLRAKFRLPVLLVAVCRNRPTASWAAGPFESRVGTWTTQVTRPFVLGPDNEATAKYWCEWLEVGLENTPVRETWRELEKMVGTYFPGRGTLFEETYLDGKAAGKAEDRVALILRVLEKRGIDLPRDLRDRITSCTDLDTLTLWFDRSLTATTAEDLFTDA
jgi:hypothetical protein